MNDAIVVSLVVAIMLACAALGAMLGKDETTRRLEQAAVATECAYYDPETAEFTWGKPDG